MGLILPGWPVTNPSRPYNPDTDYDEGNPCVRSPSGIPWYGREGHPFFIPRLGNYYITNRLNSATDETGLIIRYDAEPLSPVTWEALGNSSPVRILGHQSPILIGNGVLVAQNGISLSNAYQFIEHGRTIDANDGVFILESETALYHVNAAATSKCYKTADCTVISGAASGAVWTEQGTVGWAATPTVVRLIKSGSRLIAWGQKPGNAGIEIMVSDDDGANWTSKYSLTNAGTTHTIPTFVQRGANSVFICYREGRSGAIPPETDICTLDTTDNGNNWTRTVCKSFTGATVGTWLSFLYIDATTWLMAAETDWQSTTPETIIRTTDTGANWSVVYDTAGGLAAGKFHQYSFEIDTAVRASDGRILNIYSDDDGATWSELETGYSTVSGWPDFFAGINA